jgi:hypothetical protein
MKAVWSTKRVSIPFLLKAAGETSRNLLGALKSQIPLWSLGKGIFWFRLFEIKILYQTFSATLFGRAVRLR